MGQVESDSVVHIGNRIVFGVNQRILDLLKIGGTHYFRGFGDVAAIIDFGENIGFGNNHVDLTCRNASRQRCGTILRGILANRNGGIRPHETLVFNTLRLHKISAQRINLFGIFRHIDTFKTQLGLGTFGHIRNDESKYQADHCDNDQHIGQKVLLEVRPLVFRRQLAEGFEFRLLRIHVGGCERCDRILLLLGENWLLYCHTKPSRIVSSTHSRVIFVRSNMRCFLTSLSSASYLIICG